MGRIKTSVESTNEKQPLPHRWKPGESGNPGGRPRSSKNRLTENFLRELSVAFEEHGQQCVKRLIDEQPADFLKLIQRLMPRDLIIKAELDLHQSALELTKEQRERIAEEWLTAREGDKDAA